MTTETERRALEELEFRLQVLLPEDYQGASGERQPVPMGSATLRFDDEGKVEWDQMWQTFCDLAMAGGPPHKGALLEPGTRADVAADPARHQEVTDEICRGVVLATGLPAVPSPAAGWVAVDCFSDTMADWLLRAIVMENVAVRRGPARVLELPAGPRFRLDREIKNVVTVIAKTCHYWMGHIPRDQKRAIADLFVTLAAKGTVVEPDYDGGDRRSDADDLAARMSAAIRLGTGVEPAGRRSPGWLGLQWPGVRAAIWCMRALVASNVLARREEDVLFVPVNPTRDPGGAVVTRAVADVHRLAAASGVL